LVKREGLVCKEKYPLTNMKTFLSAFFLLLFLYSSSEVFGQRYIRPASISISGSGTYCQNGSAADITVSIPTTTACNNGSNTNVSHTTKIYSNTTNSTTGGTLVATLTNTNFSVNAQYAPPSNVCGTVYYYATVEWETQGCASAGILTTATIAVTIDCSCGSACAGLVRYRGVPSTIHMVDPNVSASAMTYTGTGNNNCEYCNGDAVNYGWGICSNQFNNATPNITSAPYFQFSVNPASGCLLAIEGIEIYIWSYANSAGSNYGARYMMAGYSTDGGTTWTTWTTGIDYDNTDCELSHTPAGRNRTWSFTLNTANTVIFRIQPYGGNSASNTSYEVDLYQATLLGCADCALPVQLLSFAGESKSNQNLLEWKTASEMNNDYFTLERSHGNHHLNWETIAVKKGAGNSNQLLSYSHLDENPEEGINYYRLKQTDFDGGFTYSDIIALETKGESKFKVSTAWPNPAQNEFNLEIYSQKESVIIINIFDFTGKIIRQYDFNIRKGSNGILLNVDDLSKGMYHLVIYDKATERREILKMLVRGK
jgi:hypothetical protein